MTDSELDALPEQHLGGTFRAVMDPATGHTSMEREPVRFLVRKGDVYAYRDSRGEYWTVGEDIEGRPWKMRA